MADRCAACGSCATICPFGAIAFNNGGERSYDWNACMGCGLCAEGCAQEALTLVRDPGKGDPLDLDLIGETLGRAGLATPACTECGGKASGG